MILSRKKRRKYQGNMDGVKMLRCHALGTDKRGNKMLACSRTVERLPQGNGISHPISALLIWLAKCSENLCSPRIHLLKPIHQDCVGGLCKGEKALFMSQGHFQVLN